MNANVTDDPLAEVINAPDPVQVWHEMATADQRVIVDRLCTVTILPSGRRGRGFDASSVRLDPNHKLGLMPAA